MQVTRVSRSGAELDDMVAAVLAAAPAAGRTLLGLAGAPGAGKSTVAAYLASCLGATAAHVPMDGFHLADAELRRQGLLGRKGAPETFDPFGYAALLGRLAEERGHTVYAPGFDRDLEQPLAGAIAVAESVQLVITEGNYLLLDRPGWREARTQLAEVWHVRTAEPLRLARLVARHVEFGKSPARARSWVEQVDGPHARLVEASADRADRILDLTDWAR